MIHCPRFVRSQQSVVQAEVSFGPEPALGEDPTSAVHAEDTFLLLHHLSEVSKLVSPSHCGNHLNDVGVHGFGESLRDAVNSSMLPLDLDDVEFAVESLGHEVGFVVGGELVESTARKKVNAEVRFFQSAVKSPCIGGAQFLLWGKMSSRLSRHEVEDVHRSVALEQRVEVKAERSKGVGKWLVDRNSRRSGDLPLGPDDYQN